MSEHHGARVIDSPLGRLRLVADRRGIRSVEFGATDPPETADVAGSPGAAVLLDRAVAELVEYFGGQRRDFDVPVVVEGTEFQLAAWETLRSIGYGESISYAEQARRMGRPTAVRAVGSANGRNPLPILIPCHRVVASDGTLGGYSGGLDIKRWLLDHEQHSSVG